MATLAPSSPESSPSSTPFHRRRKSWARKVERCCCNTFAYFPLLFVYGLTTWAVYVEVSVSFLSSTGWYAYFKAFLGLGLYGLANVSYTIAVFTTAGSPLDARQDWSAGSRKNAGYEGLPTYERELDEEDGPAHASTANMTTVTAKSTGKPRYCKKCQTVKPDRTHHCSTCGKCVLKMDHHCPWLAACVGLHNYKPFLLFLIYTSLFCWLCFAFSASWVYVAIMDDAQMRESMLVVNTILLAVLGGIIGLVLSGFTGWHIYLAVTGQTTIESLEKTRYLSPLRKTMQQQFRSNQGPLTQGEEQEQGLLEHLKETHANALPGVFRPEEGEESRSQTSTPVPPARDSSLQHLSQDATSSSSPAKASLQRSYASLEAQREQERYDSYLDEQDSERLPNAFDLGWKRNLTHVFGNKPFFWFLPVCNTSGDGWMWEVSPKWTEARAEVQKQREARAREEAMWAQQDGGFRQAPPPRRDYRWAPGQGFLNQAPANGYHEGAGSHMQMQPLDRRKGSDEVDSYDTSSDEDVSRRQKQRREGAATNGGSTANWNDVPDEFLDPGMGRNQGSRSRSRGRRKGD